VNLGDIMQLGVRIVMRGMDDVRDGFGEVEERAHHMSEALEDGRFELPFLRAYDTLRDVIDAGREAVAVVTELSGIAEAAQWQRLDMSFENLLGSADAAKDVLAELREIGEHSPFDTRSLVDFSRALIATGSDAEGVKNQLHAITDAAAAAGLQTQDVGRMMEALTHLRLTPHPDIREVGELAGLGVRLDKIVSATGKNVNEQQAMRLVQGQTGEKAFQLIVEGMRKAYGGAADKLADKSILGLLQNLHETLEEMALATGNLLLPAATWLVKQFLAVADAIKKVNDVTGGSAGLVLLILGLWRAKNLLIGSVILAISKIRELTSKIAELAVTAEAAALKTGGAAAAEASEAGAAASGGKGVFAFFKGLPALAKSGEAGAKAMEALKAFGPTLLRSVKSPNVVAILADLGLNAIGSAVGGKAGGVLKGVGTGVGWGALGLLAGPEIGVPTMIIGGIIGGILGARKKDDSKAQDTQERIAASTEKAATALVEMHGSMMGGGARGRAVASQIETEYAVARMMSMGYGT
jgi:hypothetical protein